jgi:hypothetical protein
VTGIFLIFQKTWTLWFCMGIFTTPTPESYLVTFSFNVNRATLQKSCKSILFVQQKWYLTCRVNPHFMTCNTRLSTHHPFWCWLDEDLVGQNGLCRWALYSLSAGTQSDVLPVRSTRTHEQMIWRYIYTNTNRSTFSTTKCSYQATIK